MIRLDYAESWELIRGSLNRGSQGRRGRTSTKKLSEPTLQALQALGYVEGGADAAAEVASWGPELDRFAPSGPNPMDHAEDVRNVFQAIGLLAVRKYDEAERVLRDVMRRSNTSTDSMYRLNKTLADVLILQERYEEAAGFYRKALAVQPEDRDCLHNLRIAAARAAEG